jgi:hypothetical protein
MADTPLDRLREIISRAAARDGDDQRALEAFATDFLKEVTRQDTLLVWAPLPAGKGERQMGDHFVRLPHGWLRGDLVVHVAPERDLVLNLQIHSTKDGTHEVAVTTAPSQTTIIDPPDADKRKETRDKLYALLVAGLESQLRAQLVFSEA